MTTEQLSTAIQATGTLLPVAYLIATTLCAMAFAGDRGPAVGRLRHGVVMGALLLHGLFLVLHGVAAQTFPLVDTWLTLHATALLTAALFLLVTIRSPQPTSGAFVLLLVFFMTLLATSFGPLAPIVVDRPGTISSITHGMTSVAAAAALLVSGVYGLLHMRLYRVMRQKEFGPVFRELPSLDTLAKTMRRAAFAGFIFLTIGLNVGIGYGHANRASFSYADPHVLVTLVLWLHFGVIALSRRIRGLNARRVSVAAVVGLVTVLALLLMTLVPGLTDHAPRS